MNAKEDGFISFPALVKLMALTLVGCGMFFVATDAAKTERHAEIVEQLYMDASGAAEKIAWDIINGQIELPEDIKNGVDHDITDKLEFDFGGNKKISAAVRHENNGLRLLTIVEKEDENAATFGTAECFLEDADGGYKWSYRIKTR